MTDVLVIGAGPAGALAALRAADLGARTVLVTSSTFGGMAANDGPVPVRTLAHAARLISEARQLGEYGIAVGEPVLDYPRLLARLREVVGDVLAHSSLREQIDTAGVTVHENAGAARFADPHTVITEAGLHLQADKIIICVGGVGRRLSIPGFHLTSAHSSATAERNRLVAAVKHLELRVETERPKSIEQRHGPIASDFGNNFEFFWNGLATSRSPGRNLPMPAHLDGENHDEKR